MTIEPIGVIHSPHKTKDQCPIQPPAAAGAVGQVEVFEQYAPGLKDVETFSHVYLLYEFDQAGKTELVRPPFLDDEPHGVFATRHPCRPSHIGLSVVRLRERNNNVLIVEGIDVLDGTPLLDIKPYVPKFDRIDAATNGWLADKQWRPKPKGRE